MNKEKILFIINPISGIGRQRTIEKLIDNKLDTSKYTASIQYTNAAKHAIELGKHAAGNFDIVVAIGGDGTVNEISHGLIGTNTKLAIIPTGSGNGLARFLQIPLNLSAALGVINKGKSKKIDSIEVNDNKFVNIAGIGFDALISHRFAKYGKRGFISYVKIIISELKKFKSKHFSIEIDGKIHAEESFLVTFANSSQFGNNAHISPLSKIDDGLIDVVFFKKFPMLKVPQLTLRLFNRTLDKSKYCKMLRGKEIIFRQAGEILAHIDGEPVTFRDKMHISINPLSLNVIIP